MTSCVSLYFNFVCWKLLKMIKLISRYVFLNLLDHSIFISPCSKHITKLNFHFAKNLLEYIWDLTHGKEKRLHKCHQFIWTTVFGLLDTRNLYFFYALSAPNQPMWSNAVWMLAQSHSSNDEEIVRAGRFSRFAADHMEYRRYGASFSTNCPHGSLYVSSYSS